MKCSICGGAESVTDPEVSADFCQACGEVLMDMEEVGKNSKFIDEFKEQITAQLIRAELIKGEVSGEPKPFDIDGFYRARLGKVFEDNPEPPGHL